MDIAFLIGRIIFGGYWLMSALNHFKNLNHMSEYAKAKGTPFPKLAVAGTGVILLAGGLSMLLGVYPLVGIVLIIVFLLGVSLQKQLLPRAAPSATAPNLAQLPGG
jgi:putative oxidoreductase